MLAVLVAATTLAQVTSAPIETAKKFFKAVDVPSRLRLKHLSHSAGGIRAYSSVVLVNSNGMTYTALVDSDSGRIWAAWRGSESAGVFHGQGTSAKGTPAERKVQRWFAAIPHDPSVRLETIEVDNEGKGEAYFAILRNGYPFPVSGQRYGYRLAFSPGGEFLRFTAEDNPPPVDASPARLSESEALKAVDRIFHQEVAPEIQRQVAGSRLSYRLAGKPVLGYFRPDGETRARLVWKVPFIQSMETGFGTKGGSNGMLIDARSGRRIPTRTVP